jgi:serine/threonine protein kinase
VELERLTVFRNRAVIAMKKRIGRYQIDHETESAGGFPAYLAFDRESGRNVVLEWIPEAGSDQAEIEEVRKTNRHKAEQAVRLRHAQIAQTYDVVEEDGSLWVAREPVKGETLENLLCTESAVSKDLISHVLYHTAACLDYAHQLGVQHGRLSPAELLFQDDGTLKILGFWRPCLASSGDVSAFDPTHYSAPEQIRGLAPEAASDQYSLAAITYELLTGVTPFQGNAIAVRNRIVLDMPADPSGFNASLSEEVARVLHQALNKVPGKRFGNCLEFVQALDQALETPPAWQLPTEYQGHRPGVSSMHATGQLEGEVTEALLREVLLERPVPRRGVQAIRKHFKVAGVAGIAVMGVLLMWLWAVSSSPGVSATAALSVSPAPPPPAVVHQPYSFSLQANGGRGPYEWSVVDGELPAGLTLEPEGVIRGQSDATGVFDVQVQVKGSGTEAATATQKLSLTVKQGPRIKSAETMPPAVVGREYSYSLGVEGGQRPYRWAVTSGSIPPGLSLNSFSGFLGGRAEAAGTYRFNISVSDLFAATSTRGFELTVSPAGGAETLQRIAHVASAGGE